MKGLKVDKADRLKEDLLETGKIGRKPPRRVEKYEQLLEDLHDLAVIAERREEQPMNLEAMKQRLKENGLL